MFRLVCKQCSGEFDSKSSTKKYCCRDCYYLSNIKYTDKECPVCWRMFHSQSATQTYCSHACLWKAQRTKEEVPCLECWKMFYSSQNKTYKYCSKECYTKAQTTVKEKPCKNCWKLFRWRSNDAKFCCKECKFEYAQNMPMEEKIKVLENFRANQNKISKINKKRKKTLEDAWFNVSLEYQILDRYYDLKIWNTLIEINPFHTHNITRIPSFNPKAKPKDKNYHYKKTKLALDNWYRCIMVWDWDNVEKIIYLLDDNKQQLYARKCEVKQIEYDDCHEFFEAYHLQWDTKKNKNNIYIWLYYNDELVECMSFWKPRYNKNYEWEILRLCSHKNYRVVWWANKIFKFFLEITDVSSVISYCDMSKFDWKVYESLWFTLLKWNKPSRHWYNNKESKPRRHITDNLLRQYWYDWIFWESYGKWTNNDELMRERGYVEIYDCGQSTFVWAKG